MDRANEALLGDAPAIRHIRSFVKRLARGASNVLITGETGTGKELVAQLIHIESRRPSHTFVSVNCPALPEALFESELFGHAKGAYTSADADADGQLGAADGGTVFFDEIGELSLSTQAKLLRLIETKEYRRVGARRSSTLQAQVVAATNRDLERMVAAGTFRNDLFYRLNVAQITVPPLRERIEDIDILTAHFVRQFGFRAMQPASCPEEVMAMFREYDWPGNVRELRNVIEAIFIELDGPVIAPDHLPESFLRRFRQNGCSSDVDRMRVLNALKACSGNKSRAAAALQCSRMTLYRRLAKYRVGSRSA
jgi:transcriptional regulator with PAS, ATPase and Fis domain